MAGDTLSDWLEAEGIVAVAGPGGIADVGHVRDLLLEAARERRSVSYSELLNALGHRFSRPKMRALCRTLDAIDRAYPDEPSLAVLVVREGDRLPGQGWWVAARAQHGHDGPSQGAQAARYVADRQLTVFEFWRARQDSNLRPRA